jgi:hypothetical protein
MLTQQIALTVTATLSFIAAVYYTHTVYQLSNPSFRLSTSPLGTFDLIKQKVLQVCALDNSDAQKLSAAEIKQRKHESPSDAIRARNAEYKTQQDNQIYALCSAIASAAYVVALYLTKKGNSDGDEMVLDGRFKQNLKAAYERCQRLREDLNQNSPEFISLVNSCGEFIESQCMKENKYEGVLQSAGMLHELQNMMSIPKEGKQQSNREFLQENLLSAIYDDYQRNSSDSLFVIASSPTFRNAIYSTVRNAGKRIFYSKELVQKVSAREALHQRELIDDLAENMLKPKWFATIQGDNYEYGPFQDFFDYLKTATSGEENTIWAELRTEFHNAIPQQLTYFWQIGSILREISSLREDEGFLRYGEQCHYNLDNLMSQINNRDDPYDRDNPYMNNDSEPPLLRDIDNFLGEFIYKSADQIRRNGFDTQKKRENHSIEDLMNFASRMRIQTENHAQKSIVST